MVASPRVLVTGGTGFIGREVIKELVTSGYQVVALARTEEALPQHISTTTTTTTTSTSPLVHAVLKGDISHLEGSEISAFMKTYNVSTVIHMAAVMDFYPDDEDHMWNVNVEGTRKLATASVDAGVSRFIFISSTEAMGAPRATPAHPTRRPLTEGSACHPHFKYGHSKVAAEALLKEMAPRLPYIILRLTGVLGPGDEFAIHELLQSISYGLFFFAPRDDGKAMFTHIDDVVSGIMCAVTHNRPKQIIGNTYIICPDNCLTYSECIAFSCKKLNRIQPIIKLPIPVIRVITQCVGPLLNLGKKKVFLFKTDTIDRMGEDRWYSNEKAKRELAFSPKYRFEEGLQHAINHMIRKGLVNTWYISPVMLFFFVCLMVGSCYYFIK